MKNFLAALCSLVAVASLNAAGPPSTFTQWNNFPYATWPTNSAFTFLVGGPTSNYQIVPTNILRWTGTNADVALNRASNVLFSFIVGGGINAALATNIAENFATNSAIVTSNDLRALLIAGDAATSNALQALAIANDTTTSNGAVAVAIAASNTLFTVIQSGDSTTSNALRSLIIAGQITTNDSQFGASSALTIRDGVKLTNVSIYGVGNAWSGTSTITGQLRFNTGTLVKDEDGTCQWNFDALATSNTVARFGQISLTSNGVVSLLIAATNQLAVNFTAQLNAASNILYGFITGGGISAGVATNIAEYFATNSSAITSNALLSLMTSRDTTTSNGAVAFAMAVSNAVAALAIANDTTTSNGVVSFTMTASNNLAALLIASDTTTSNALQTLFIANDTTTSNGAVAFSMTASNNVITFVISATNTLASAGRAELLSASNYLAGLVGGSALGITTNFEYYLSSGTATGITAIVLDRVPVFTPSTVGGVTRGSVLLAIGLGTTNCELRRAATISSTTVNLNGGGFQYAHAAGERVLWFAGDAQMYMWGLDADSTLDRHGLQNAIHEANKMGIFLDGAQCTYGHDTGLVGLHDGRLKRVNFTTVSPFLANGTNDSLFAVAQGERYFFTADPSADTITVVGGWLAPTANNGVTNTGVIFQGTNLPAPIAAGKFYFIKGGDSNSFQIGLSTNAAVLDLTTAGAGNNFVYTEVRSMSRYYFDDVAFTGNNLASNGVWTVLQQPMSSYKLRINSVVGTGLRLDESQDGIFENTMIIDCLNPLDDRNSVNMQFLSLNMEHFAGNWFLGGLHNQYLKVHVETGNEYSGGSVINATSTVPVDCYIAGFYVTQSANKDVILEAGNANQAAGIKLQNVYVPSTFGSDQLIIKDVKRGHRIYGYKDGSGASAAQYIDEYIMPDPPSGEDRSEDVNAWNMVSLDGGMLHIGSQLYNKVFAWHRAGTNHTADEWQWRQFNNERAIGISNGVMTFYAMPKLNTNAVVGYVATVMDTSGRIEPQPITVPSTFNTLTVTNQLRVGDIGPWINAASFDGSTDYASRGADMTGNMDTNRVTGEFWFKSSATNVERSIFGSASANQHFSIALDNNDLLQIQGWSNSPAGLTLKMTSSSAYGDITTWHHAMFSFNLDPANSGAHLYVDGTNALSATITTNGCMIDMTADDWTVGTRGDSFTKWNGCLADVVLWAGTNAVYTDLSVSATRLKFYNSGKAIDPGATGTTPTGTRPMIYLREWSGVNAGFGGNFTVNGTLSDSCTPPPTFGAMEIVQVNTNYNTGLRVIGAPGQYADLAQYSDGTNIVSGVTSNGAFYGPNVLASNATLGSLSSNPYKGYTNQAFGGTNTSVRTAGGTNFVDTTGELNNWAQLSTNAIKSTATNTAIWPKLAVAFGGSASNATVGGLIYSENVNSTNLNANGTLSNSFALTIRANALTNIGAALRGEFDFRPHDTAPNTNRYLVAFGGATLFDTGLIISNNHPTTLKVKLEVLATNSFHMVSEVVTRLWFPSAGTFTNTYDFVISGNAFIDNTFNVQIGSARLGGLTNTGSRVYSEAGALR